MLLRRNKIIAALLLLSFILLLAACAPDAVREGGSVVRGQPPDTADYLSYYADETIVYVTRSGKKYHTEDCSYLTDTAAPVSLEQAVAEGKTPCSRCHPPE
jgi:hypothetical protein